MIVDALAALVGAGLLAVLLYGGRWALYASRAYRRPAHSVDWECATIHPRIVTVGDDPALVQSTVDDLPDELGHPSVISERPLDITGAAVHVVPEDFSCGAEDKGRAIEWARRVHPPTTEYVLYLDEDTRVPAFDGIPDADIVQLRRRPSGTPSWLVRLMEIHRAGILYKELGFGDLPFHAWGGAIIVRRSVEDDITWERDALGEDTAFVWAAATAGYSCQTIPVLCDNQAPPSPRVAIQQRRRWAAMWWEADRLPLPTRLDVRGQLLAWNILPFTLPLVAVGLGLAAISPSYHALGALAAGVVLLNAGWSLVGGVVYGARWTDVVALLCGGFFIATVVNFAGRVWGTVSPPDGFVVTEKTAE